MASDANAALNRVVIPGEVLARLVEVGKARGGVLTQEAVLEVVTLELTPDVLQQLVNHLAVRGVVVEEPDEVPVVPERVTLAQVVDGVSEPEAPSSTAMRRRAVRLTPDRLAESRASGSADPVRMYLKEIGRVPLLNAAEEVELAKRIEAGALVDERLAELTATGEITTLDFGERRKLERLSRVGDYA
jgi:RNA polymerase primary sigma factor